MNDCKPELCIFVYWNRFFWGFPCKLKPSLGFFYMLRRTIDVTLHLSKGSLNMWGVLQ